jgi:hypothetical protein
MMGNYGVLKALGSRGLTSSGGGGAGGAFPTRLGTAAGV